MNKLLKKIKKFVLNLFFPKKCLGCGQADIYLCPTCFNKIEIVPTYQKQKYLDKLIAVTEYKNPLIRELIKSFKYHFVRELARPLGCLLIKALEKYWKFEDWKFIIIPIPLYAIRIRKRGFNQAELLAKEVSKHFNLPLKTDILKRIITTEPQANIKDEEKRKQNIKGVFALKPKYLVKGKSIILIDDVTTTGATLIEAAKILKKSGANEVWGLVVAKGK